MNYTIAQGILNGRSAKELAPNTILHYSDQSSIKLRFYETDIITFLKNGSVLVDCKGIRTKTTKDRLNNFLPLSNKANIKQVKGKWYWLDDKEYKDKSVIKDHNIRVLSK